MKAFLSAPLALRIGPPVLIAVACAALFALLLMRHPYDGFYGQDSYAYYYQARALWQEISGQAMPPDQLFSAQALRWPVGYLLHLALGIVLSGGPGGGRVITLALTALTPALIYLIITQLWSGASQVTRIAAGLIGSAILPLTGTYTRMGLSIMADVPALFWMVLAIFCCLKAWPPYLSSDLNVVSDNRGRLAWACGMGLALGMAVLVRYGSILLLAPITAYLALLKWQRGSWRQLGGDARKVGLAILGFAIALVPQLLYYVSPLSAAPPGAANYGAWLSSWNPSNIFASNFISPDGTASYPQSNIVFYLLQPFWPQDVDAGLLSLPSVPALLLGVWALIAKRRWPVLGLLLTWWLVPVLFFSGSTYQAHRFVLVYLPALAILIGTGAGVALEWLLQSSRTLRRLSASALAAIVLLGVSIDAYLGLLSVNRWILTHATFEAGEKRVAAVVMDSVEAAPATGLPHVVSFNITAAVYHYTGWPMLDFYNHDEEDIAHFLAGDEPHVLVVPEKSMTTQWLGTPSGTRWEWIRRSYDIHLFGQVGEYSVYTIGGRR
ncbi:MAG TPA: phospholipid carrier-dependent glycosyltransferase [Chloroflexia bacterium]|nr:phospholipid carrier-dependent glycosyltransferase [Chloroflexia bacterium]